MDHTHRLTIESTTLERIARTLMVIAVAIVATASLDAQTPVYRFTSPIGGQGSDYPVSSATDANGNVYLTGHFDRTVDFDPGPGVTTLTSTDTMSWDAFVASYDANGSFRWAFALGGVGYDQGDHIDVDGAGNVFVCGSAASTTDFDPGTGVATRSAPGMFIARYTATGGFIWANRVDASSLGGLALDPTGNLLCLGNRGGAASNTMFVTKYSSSGASVWSFQLGGGKPSNPGVTARALAVDGNGNVIVHAVTNGSIGFDPTAKVKTKVNGRVVAKYTTAGAYQWAFGLLTPDASNIEFRAMRVDGAGNIVAVGNLQGTVDFNPSSATANLTSAGASDIVVAKYAASGSYQWAFRLGGSGTEVAHSVAIDDGGNIYASGGFNGTVDFDPGSGVVELTPATTAAPNFWIAKYSPTGGYAWALTAGGELGGTRTSIALGANDDVVTTGAFNAPGDFDPGAGEDLLTPTLNQWGQLTRDGFITTYSQVIPMKGIASKDVGSSDLAASIVPNPFTSRVTIRLADTVMPATIRLLDMMGRIIETRQVIDANDEITLGTNLPAGTYLLHVEQKDRQRSLVIFKTD